MKHMTLKCTYFSTEPKPVEAQVVSAVSYPPPTVSHWRSIDAILIVLATPGTGLGGKNRIYPSLRSCLGAIVW